MSLSLNELRAVAAALRPRLVGGQLQRVRQPDDERLVLGIRGRQVEPAPDTEDGERPAPGPGVTWDLLFCVRARVSRVHPTWQPAPPRPANPLPFDQRLRATVLDGRVTDVTMPWDDRVLALDLLRGGGRYRLLAELSGHHANLFLLDEAGAILASLRPSASRRRDLRVGNPYVAPLPAERLEDAAPTLRGEALLRELDERYAQRETRDRLEARYQRIAKALRGERKRLERLAGRLAKDLDKARDGEQWRERGELLKGALHEVRKGAAEVEVTDWADPEQRRVTIPLDPARSPQDNLAALFARYKKAQRGRPQVEARMAETDERLERVKALLNALDASERSDAALDDLEARVRDAGVTVGPGGRKRPSERRKEGRHVPYRRYVASDGAEILVGKGGADNGTLTFRVARDNDLWLHARDAAGAHVVVRARKGRTTSRETMIEAGLLAAHFSKRRGDRRVEVHLTPKRHVRPIKGAPAGTVRVERSETLLVELDEGLLARVLRTLA